MCPEPASGAPPAGRPPFVLVTCEHAGREVPPEYARLFRGAVEALRSHRGWDPGAFPVAQRLAAHASAPLIASTVTRLLVDLNRSPDRPDTFSERTRVLPEAERARILDRFYTPHRDAVTRTLRAVIEAGHRAVHLGVHSCTDVLDGRTRDLDIALLFDEGRPLERAFCEAWRSAMLARRPDLRFPFNEPYRGADDGLTTTLRGLFRPEAYLGIEIELRQGFVRTSRGQRDAADLLVGTLASALAGINAAQA